MNKIIQYFKFDMKIIKNQKQIKLKDSVNKLMQNIFQIINQNEQNNIFDEDFNQKLQTIILQVLFLNDQNPILLVYIYNFINKLANKYKHNNNKFKIITVLSSTFMKLNDDNPISDKQYCQFLKDFYQKDDFYQIQNEILNTLNFQVFMVNVIFQLNYFALFYDFIYHTIFYHCKIILLKQAFMFINQYPQHEFLLQDNNQQYQQQEDFIFFDFEDQQKVKCYFPNSTLRPSMKLPKIEWAESKEEKQKILQDILQDINISTPDIKITSDNIQLLNSKYYVKPQIDQFVEQKIQVYDQNHNELTNQQIVQMAALGQLTVSGFKKNQLQKTKDIYARPIDIDELKIQRKVHKVDEIQHTLPRLFIYRKQSNQKDDEFRKQRMMENLENFIPIGKFIQNNMIYATCLPSSQKGKEECQLLKIDIAKNSQSDQNSQNQQPQLNIYLGCSRLCKFKDMAEQYYQQYDKEYIVCNK